MTASSRLASLILGIALALLALALMPPRLLAAPFTDVGGPSGTGDTTDDVGAAWGDYDNDGDLDLYLSKDGSQNKLYRNNGNGTFTNVGVASGTANTGAGRGVAWGDYDSDGFLDLYLANDGANRLYHNNGNGTFTEVGAASGTADAGSGRGVAWGDYDSDGFLDLYLANDGPNRLYHNNGNGTFTEVGAATGTADTGNGVGVAWGDYDNDRDLDLYLANDNGTNRLYRNNGNGTFTETAAAAGCSDTGRSFGVAWGDYDSDGDLDLYVGKYGTANRLFRNNGNSTFTSVGPASNTDDTGNATGVAWGDYDHDGDLDLYVANVASANRHYRNNGNGTFTDVASSMGTNDPGNAQGVAWADYDNDGDLDLYLANVLGADRLFRNDTAVAAGSHWLHVNLVGAVSNRSGIGARVRCVTGAISRICEISGGSGYLSQGSLTAEFGLGTAATVDSLIVHWPSGIVQAVAPPSADQRITVREPGSEYFTDVTQAAGTLGAKWASAWADYDNDDDLDLFIADAPNKLYQNTGNGTFTNVAAAAGITSSGHAGAWADYDNDGDLDLYVPYITSRLYRNNGNGTFSDVAAAAGTADLGFTCGWGDYDSDGNIDLYVSSNINDHLYRNNGDGTFTDVAGAAGTSAPSSAVGLAWADYDYDSDLDIYVGGFNSNSTPNRLYRNNGNGTFTDVAGASGAVGNWAQGVSWGDFDNDGDLDLDIANWGGLGNMLYKNLGNGTFTDWTGQAGVLGPPSATAAVWGDYNNDGHLDLYVTWDDANGSPSHLYRNAGDGTFSEVGAGTATNTTGDHQSANWADYDNDGVLDLHVTGYRLFRNESPARHWLHVKLVGTVSNRAGIGARVRCVSGGRSMTSQISGGEGFSQGPLVAEFGLGASTIVDSLVISWPSGIVQAIVSPSIDQRITVTEPGQAQFQFTDAGAASGTNDSGPSLGVAWGDYDSDGDLDLYLAQAGPTPQNRLYRNNGNDTFTNVAVASGTAGNGDSHAAVWGDYDNDGDLDLYLTAHGGTNQLFRNNGDGTFTDVGAASGTNDTGSARSAAWGDYDQDGFLDLYVAKTGANRLYRNQGNGTFSEVGAATGTNDAGDGTGVAWGDYDSDGDLDLFVANHLTPNRLYRNNGNGTFTDVSVAAGTDHTGPSHGVAWADYDNDGDLDLYVANLGTPNLLYRNNGTGTFTEVGAASGTADGGLSRGVAWGDFDDDGYLDLYVTNDGVSRLYKNNGNGTFSESAGAYGTAGTGLAVGVAWADYDGDGDLDLYVAVLDGPNHLYRNDNPLVGNHWLEVDLVGTQSNREGIGARVRCVAGGRSLIREVSGGSGYLSQEPLIARFGLGLATAVDTLEVRWPSGIVQVVTNPGVDQQITVTEQETSDAPDTAMIPSEYSLLANVPNPFNPSTVIGFDLPTQSTVELTVYDVAGRPVRRLLAGIEQPAGRHQVIWDGRSDQGSGVASGIYFYRIVANDFRATRRMTLLK